MNRTLIFLVLMIFSFTLVRGQEVDSAASDWSFAASAYYYIIPSEKNTATLIGYADYKSWHFEGRYNYEDRKTGSVFTGKRFEWGNKFVFGATPMLGFVFGNTNGLAPGLELDASWRKFDYYSETEYVIDYSGKENNFIYVWGEIGFNAFKSFRTGLSYQRTKLYQSQFQIQRGIFAEYQFWKISTGIYVFDPFSDSQFLIASLNFEF